MMPYVYPYPKVLVQDDVDFSVAAHHNAQENQLEQLTEAVKALDDLDLPTVKSNVLALQGDVGDLEDFRDLFPTSMTGDQGKALVVNATEDGYEHASAGGGQGLLEPGLILSVDPGVFVVFGWGWSGGPPLYIVVRRALYPHEQVHLLVHQDDGGGNPSLLPALAVSPSAPWGFANFYHQVVASSTGNLMSPNGFAVDSKILAVLGIWDTTNSRWVDKVCVDVVNPPM